MPTCPPSPALTRLHEQLYPVMAKMLIGANEVGAGSGQPTVSFLSCADLERRVFVGEVANNICLHIWSAKMS